MIIEQVKQLLKFASKRRRGQLLGVLVLTMVAAVSELASVGAVLPFLMAISSPELLWENETVNRILLNLGMDKSSPLVFFLTMLFVGAILSAGISRFFLLWFQTRTSYAIGSDISSEIYRRTLYQSYEVHLSRNSSEVLSAINLKVKDVINQAIGPSISIVSSSILLFAIGFFLFFIDPLISTISFFLFGILYFSIALFVRKKLLFSGKIMASKQTEVTKVLQEGLMGIRDVILMGAQEVYLSAFRNAEIPRRDATTNIIIISQAPRFFVEAGGMTLIAIIAYILVDVLDRSTIVLPILGALALGAQRIMPLLQQIYWSYSQLHGSQASLSDILGLLQQSDIDSQSTIQSRPINFHNEIAIKNVSFSYSSEKPPVLENIELTIKKGGCLGIVGETGSGKSTILDIIMGLILPKSGSLLVDGVKIERKQLKEWQKHIAHVPQSIYLSDVSIEQNIAFGIPKEKIDRARIQAVAKMVHLDKVIESWELGYQTLVGECGVRLSGGQKQRIGIARALYRQVDVLVLDEATSALDHETESIVMDEISRMSESLTIIMVAHRLSSLKKCDSIIKLNKGNLIELGEYSKAFSEL